MNIHPALSRTEPVSWKKDTATLGNGAAIDLSRARKLASFRQSVAKLLRVAQEVIHINNFRSPPASARSKMSPRWTISEWNEIPLNHGAMRIGYQQNFWILGPLPSLFAFGIELICSIESIQPGLIKFLFEDPLPLPFQMQTSYKYGPKLFSLYSLK